METLNVGRGFGARWTVTLRDERGVPLTGVYDGTEPLDLKVSDLVGGLASMSGSTVTWLSSAAGTVSLFLDEADTAPLGPGPRSLSIGVTDAGERYEGYVAVLRVGPRAHV